MSVLFLLNDFRGFNLSAFYWNFLATQKCSESSWESIESFDVFCVLCLKHLPYFVVKKSKLTTNLPSPFIWILLDKRPD